MTENVFVLTKIERHWLTKTVHGDKNRVYTHLKSTSRTATSVIGLCQAIVIGKHQFLLGQIVAIIYRTMLFQHKRNAVVFIFRPRDLGKGSTRKTVGILVGIAS
jgi:hypothetical protein